MEITKEEDEDSEPMDNTEFIEGEEEEEGVPSTSTEDQPGPSGVGKNVEAPSVVSFKMENFSEFYNDVEVKKEEYDSDYKPSVKAKKNKRQWTCKKCLETFPKRTELEAHRKVHAKPLEETSLTCAKCQQHFGSRKDLTKHWNHECQFQEQQSYKFCAQSEAYVCSSCSAEFQEETEVKEHLKSHEKTFLCEQCNEKIDSPYAFAMHMQKHSTDKSYHCPLCSHTTLKRTNILLHINRVHYYKYYFYCKTCGKGFNNQSILSDHQNIHLGVKPFVCIVCDKTFTYSRNLIMHQIRAHNPDIKGQILKNQCSFCYRIFSKYDTLMGHVLKKHSSTTSPRTKTHLCHICGKGFAYRDKFKLHLRVHSGYKPYKCQYCPKTFSKKDSMVMHERIHTGERPYGCSICQKRFNQHTPLKVHMRTHTGERPYVCQFCHIGFTTKAALDMHKRTCSGTI